MMFVQAAMGVGSLGIGFRGSCSSKRALRCFGWVEV